MNKHCQNFIRSLDAAFPSTKKIESDMASEWAPEEPPVTTLFAAVGYEIAESFDSNDEAVNRSLFALIEKSMDSADPMLGVAVATGLIEGMATRAAQVDGLWARITPQLGPKSLSHANAWLSP
jgi:hypothetical protein